MADASESRFDKSLGLLAQRFIAVISQKGDEIIDLKEVAGVCHFVRRVKARLITVCRATGGEAEAADLRHHQRAGGHWHDREGQQELRARVVCEIMTEKYFISFCGC